MIIVGSEFANYHYQEIIEDKHNYFLDSASRVDLGEKLSNVILIIMVNDKITNLFDPKVQDRLTFSLDYTEGMNSAQVSYKDYLYIFMDSSQKLDPASDTLEASLESIKPHIESLVDNIYSLTVPQTTLSSSTNIPEELGLTNPMNALAEELQLQVETLESDLNSAIRAINRKQRALVRKRKVLAVARSSGVNRHITVDHELVDSWTVIENQLWFTTKKLECYSPESDFTAPLGRMLVNVNLENLDENSEAFIRIYNLDRVEFGWEYNLVPHPHVVYNADNGVCTKPCLGNYMDSVVTAVIDGEYEMLVEYLIRFLTSANTEDEAGKWIKSFQNDVSFSNQKLTNKKVN